MWLKGSHKYIYLKTEESSVMIGGCVHERGGRRRGEIVLCRVEVEEVIGGRHQHLIQQLYGLLGECV